jgi:hypothetical protein
MEPVFYQKTVKNKLELDPDYLKSLNRTTFFFFVVRLMLLVRGLLKI